MNNIEPNKNNIKSISLESKKDSNKDNYLNSKNNKSKKKISKTRQNSTGIKTRNYKTIQNINNKKINNSLSIIIPIKINYNKIRAFSNSKPKYKQIKPLNKENKDIVHKKIVLNKKNNRNLENMNSTRTEIVNKIKNFKKIWNRLDNRSQTTDMLFCNLKLFPNNIINIKNSEINNQSFDKIDKNESIPKKEERILADILSDSDVFIDNGNFIENEK